MLVFGRRHEELRGDGGRDERHRLLPERAAESPYPFVHGRPFREARLRSYIVARHRAGLSLAEIAVDPYTRQFGSETLFWRVVVDPRTIEALEQNVRDAIARCHDGLVPPETRER
jgi:hypothetical protein